MRKIWDAPQNVGNGVLWLVGIAMQIGGWVNQQVAIGLLIGAGVWTAVSLIRWRRKIKTEQPTAITSQQQPDISKTTIDILHKMHKRTLELKDKALKQYIRLFSPNDFMALLNNFTASMQEHRASIATVRKEVGRRKLSKDKGKRRQQVDDLLSRLSPIIEIDWTLDKIVALGHILDKFPCEQNPKYKGIAQLREHDRQWNKLFGQLNEMKLQFPNIFADKSLGSMIKDYLDCSYGSSSLHLWTDLFNKFVPIGLTPTEYISSGTHDPGMKIQDRITTLLTDIANRINELQDAQVNSTIVSNV